MSDEERATAVEDEDQLEIEVVDDRPEEDRNRAPASDEEDEGEDFTDEEIAKLGAKTQKRIQKLTWRYHEERRAKEEAERLSKESVGFARNIQDRNKQLRDALQRYQQEYEKEREKSTTSSVEMAQAKLAAAYEEGDPVVIAKAQSELTQAQIASQTRPRMQPIPDESSESTPRIQMPEPDPKAVEWQARNTWFGVDSEMTSLAYGVHERLIREGVDPNSSEYYQRIDARMREVFPHRFDGSTSEEREQTGGSKATQQPSRSIVAPATRNSGGPPRNRVQLTQTQVALAKRLGLTPEQYARQLLIDQGG